MSWEALLNNAVWIFDFSLYCISVATFISGRKLIACLSFISICHYSKTEPLIFGKIQFPREISSSRCHSDKHKAELVQVLQSLWGNFDMQNECPNALSCLWDFWKHLQDAGEKFQGWKQLKRFHDSVPAQHSLLSLVLHGFKHVFIVKGRCWIPQEFPSRTIASFLNSELFGKGT